MPAEVAAGPPARWENAARLRVGRNASSVHSRTLCGGIPFVVVLVF